MTHENNKLSKFTDFFKDDLPNSQPISLPSSSDSHHVVENNVEPERIHPPMGYGQKGEFRCVEEVDSKYRAVFTYKYFNLVQSKLIDDALYSDKSMVVCAPTGSGKTVVFEMAIVQLLTEIEEMNYTEDYKIIYMAPVKALCSERLAEWYPKFTRLGLLCIEVTGDTDVDFPQLKPYKIIITTPEKWDMLTRRWKAHRALVEMIKLFLIDEVHILNDEIRGPVLEAVVSRMKTVEASAQSSHRIEHLQRKREGLTSPNTPPPRIRFVAVSATVSNPDDVAAWLGTRDRPAVFYKFGDECRPVRLRRVVEGYPCAAGTSIFKFDIILNYKIWPLIQRYHNGKPTLIFCNTRKSVLLTAETLSKEITVSFSQEQMAKLMEIASTIKTKKIQSLILSGIGCHHAGLLYEERQTIEDAFRDRKLPILITTTTLAMGVNLPAHLVIIKNTQQYVNGTYQEYSISTILQMVGRAGRPQYDSEATAVIMTRSADKARYEALVGGCEPLQSYLHKRIAENLNSEAALSTVCDVAQCVQWLNSTFFSVRAARDPKRYLGLPATAPAHQISKKIEELCVKAMNGLASAGLITMDEASCIESTEAGRLMSVYYLDLETMKLIMKIDGSETLEQLLWLVCESHELSEMHLRVDERRSLNLLNRNKAAPTIRFPMKGKISTKQMKSNCLIQAILGCLPILDPSLNQEATKIIRIAERVCKCLVAYMTRSDTHKSRYFSAVLNSLVLCKCVCAHLWEHSPYMSKQLRGIGPALSALLATAGKVNFAIIEESHPRDLERIINKAPPSGNLLRKQVSLLPKYAFKILPLDQSTVRVQLTMLNAAFLAENLDHLTAGANHKCYIIVGDSENYILHFSSFKDSDLVSVYDGCITFEVTRLHNHEHKITVHCISSNFVGLDERCEHIFASVLPATTNDFEINGLKENYRETKEHEGIIAKNNKRRLTIDVDQCNEKKKRGNNFLESLQNLKKSVMNSTHDFKTELNKTKDLTNFVDVDILKHGQDISVDNELSLMMCNPEKDVIVTNSSYNIDDEICSILNDIECEINNNHSENNKVLQNQNKDFERIEQNAKPEACNKVTCPYNKKPSLKCKRSLNTKNNFSFLDSIEKQDEEEIKKTEGGLPDFVKEQILQFLGKAKNESIKKYFAVDVLTAADNKVKDRPSSKLNNSEQKESFNAALQKNDEDILLDTTKNMHFENVDISSNNFTTEDRETSCKNFVIPCFDDHLNLIGEKMNENITEMANETTESNWGKDLLQRAVNKEMTNNTKLVPYPMLSHDQVAKISSDLVYNTDMKFLTANCENSNKIAIFNDIQRPKYLTNPKNLNSTCETNNSVAIVSTKTNIIALDELAKHSYDSKTIYPHATNKNWHKMGKVNDVQLPEKNTNFEGITSICESHNMSKLDTQQNITYLNFGPHLNKNIDTNKIRFDENSKDHRNEKNYFKNHTKEKEYMNKFSYSASNINVLTEKDSEIRIVNKVEIDLKVTKKIICKDSSSKDKLNVNKENLEPSNESIKDDICTELESINKNVKYDLIDARKVKQDSSNYSLNPDTEANKSAKTAIVSIVQCVDNNIAKEGKCPLQNIIEKYKTKARDDAHQKSHNLPKQNKTITPVLARQVKSQKQYRIKDINKTDDINMKNISQIFREGKQDVKELPTAIPSLPIIDSEYTKLKPNLDAITNSNSTKLNLDSDKKPVNQNFTDTKNSITKNYTNVEDSVVNNINYPIFTTDPNSPLTPEDVMSVLECENEEINLSMLNPKTLLQSLTNDALEVIPPPKEFCDYAYSPVTSNNPANSEISSYSPNSSPHNKILLPKPTYNVETWSLSQESDDYDNFEHKFTPLDSFTMFGNQNSPCSGLNLSQFKYEGKPKLRK